MDVTLFSISLACLVVLLLIVLLKKLRQPYLIAYLTAGTLLRPVLHCILPTTQQIETIGEVGLLLLMFFLGMEMHIPNRRSLLIKPFIAQVSKTLLGIGFAFLIGRILHLPNEHCIILSMLFVFNSTAIVSDYLRRNGQLATNFGIVILNMLLLQDVLLAPTLTLLRFLSSSQVQVVPLIGAAIACALIFVLLKSIRGDRIIRIPGLTFLQNDHDLQVFFGLSLCLGFGTLAELAGLTSSIGSFIAGILIGRSPALHWLEKTLRPLRVFFVAFFFMSIGLQLDLSYIMTHPELTLIAASLILISNSLLSALIFRVLQFKWADSFYAGALLAHTGEFGILACSLAHSLGLIDSAFFKVVIATTGLSLLLSTVWIQFPQRLVTYILRSKRN
ncbi:cation:proton antiporter [Danxiaibacter flavus]|uniref:Cation:proton antiporter n=1 Tax=Danxiaibacter flavus TaxID=3049108 RepID=A0ABV3ZI41_9BACT|nr:cation:proton antiporter [Chitinophagaceae bacterium DXS]